MKIQHIICIFCLIIIIGCKTTTTIYTIGDSTMANKPNPDKNPERGWAQVLPAYFTSDVIVVNKAVNGRSTRSFIDENRWDTVFKALKRGDYVFIQFGHNDQKDQDPKRFTNPHTAYRYNLIKFVTESRKKGANPVLFTSIVRRNFNDKGVFTDSHGDYPLEVRLVAQEYKVPLIDLQYYTELMEEKNGVDGSKLLHLHFKPGEMAFYPDGKDDDTHLSEKGANEISKLVIEQLKQKNIPLKKYIKNNN
jgi:lysophospholipase L1-like esterase